MPIGMLTTCVVFLLFVVVAANGSYGGAFFFWTGFVGSPLVGAIAATMNSRHCRPLAILGVVTATAIMLPFLAYGVFILLLDHDY